MTELQDNVAFVTGGSRGIGRAIVLELARRGATVMCTARNEEKLSETASLAADLPGSVQTAVVDMTDRRALEQTIEQLADSAGKIDILVNNAGITRDGLFMSMDDDQFEQVIDVNLKAVFAACRVAGKYMVRARSGSIINIGSVSGVMGNAGQANYAAAKAGLIGLTKSIAKEVGRRGVRANVVAPGFVETDMTDVLPDKVKEHVKPLIPLQRFGKAEEIAAVVAFLAGQSASYITGQVLCVDGGLHM